MNVKRHISRRNDASYRDLNAGYQCSEFGPLHVIPLCIQAVFPHNWDLLTYVSMSTSPPLPLPSTIRCLAVSQGRTCRPPPPQKGSAQFFFFSIFKKKKFKKKKKIMLQIKIQFFFLTIFPCQKNNVAGNSGMPLSANL